MLSLKCKKNDNVNGFINFFKLDNTMLKQKKKLKGIFLRINYSK